MRYPVLLDVNLDSLNVTLKPAKSVIHMLPVVVDWHASLCLITTCIVITVHYSMRINAIFVGDL